MNKLKFKTKYFGDIILNVDDGGADADADVKLGDKEIFIFLSDYSIYGDKINICLEIIDKYVEIHKLAKQAILENFDKNANVNYYFECHFDILEEEWKYQ